MNEEIFYMFNSKLKNDALAIHERATKRYNESHQNMLKMSSNLYDIRLKAIGLTKTIEEFINTIANVPKEFEIKMGMVKEEVKEFRETEAYAKEALVNQMHLGIGVATAVAAGNAFAGMAPTVAMKIATTFGRASTGIAIKSLSGAVAKKAGLAWLGGGALSAGGAGVVGGQALLALAGPIGWSISAASAGASLISMTKKNKKISDDAIAEAKKIMKVKEELDETTKKIEDLYKKTDLLTGNLAEQFDGSKQFRGVDYGNLRDEAKTVLGTLVNNTLSLVSLINVIIE
jgi:hypothetical protein